MSSEIPQAVPPPLEDWDAESFTPQEMVTIEKFAKTFPIKTRIVNPSELTGMSKAQKKAYLRKYSSS